MRSHLTCLFLIISQFLSAQTDQPLHFERVEGLSQNTVYSIMKDKHGFMWIATADGLNRFDGVEMKVYKPPPEKQYGKLMGRTIRTKIIEAGEDLWFSTEVSLYRFNKKNEFFKLQYFGDTTITAEGLTLESVARIGDRFWFAYSTGIYEFDDNKKEYHFYGLPAENNYHPIYIQTQGVYDNNGRIWFISNNGLSSFNIVDHQWEFYLQSSAFSGLTINKDTLYMASGNQIIFFEIKNHSTGIIPVITTPGNSNHINSVNTFYTDPFQNVWAGDKNGNVFYKANKSEQFVWKGNINDGAGSNYPVYCFYVDEYGMLWVGGDVIGLMKAKINYSGFNSYPAENRQENKNNFFVNAIYEDENNKVWLGTFRKGLFLLDKKTLTVTPQALPNSGRKKIDDISVSLIKKDNAGNLWIGSGGNLYVKENAGKSWSVIEIPIPPGSFSTYIKANCILDYKKGWLLGTSVGLYTLEKKNKRFVIHYNMKQSQSSICDIWPSVNNDMWIGYEGSGLLIVNKDRLIDTGQLHFNQTGIKSFLADDEHNIVWISTLTGLIAYHILSQKYKVFTEADGMGNSYVYGVLKNNNELWISTNKGLSKGIVTWNKNEIFPSVRFINYTSNDGLPDNEFNTGAFHKGNSGDFYFGTINGLSWFRPENINPNPNPPVIRLLEVKVNEENTDTIAAEYVSSLILPYFKNNLYFRFRGIEFLNASNVTYAYKMEELDKDWIKSDKLNEVRYYGMRPGSYVFKVKAANGSGVWSEKEIKINLIIHAPFWKKWWFYSLAGILLIVIVVAVTRYISQNRLKERIRKLEKQQAVNTERNRISKDMHDEIGSGLTRIALITELMHTQQQLDEKTKQGVNEIAGSTRQLVESMSEIIWALNSHYDTLEGLLAYLREQTQNYFEPLNVNYRISFPETVPDIKLSNEQRRNLFLVSKEALNNALKHSGADSIEFIASATEKKLKFSIIDNGKGIDSTTKRAGANGIRNMQQRMKDIKGEIEWVSQNENGTRVNYWINF